LLLREENLSAIVPSEPKITSGRIVAQSNGVTVA